MRQARSKSLPCGRPAPKAPESGKSASRSEIISRLGSFIAGRGLNRSASRDRILDVMMGFSAHFSVGDVVREVQARHSGIGAATVYRNFPIFIEAGVIRESFLGSSRQPYYELELEEHHDHIVCLDCNAVFEFHEESIEKAQDRVCRKLGFKPASHRHVIYAHCHFRRKRHEKN